MAALSQVASIFKTITGAHFDPDASRSIVLAGVLASRSRQQELDLQTFVVDLVAAPSPVSEQAD
eukprot:4278406-Amphidinium_carterae.3